MEYSSLNWLHRCIWLSFYCLGCTSFIYPKAYYPKLIPPRADFFVLTLTGNAYRAGEFLFKHLLAILSFLSVWVSCYLPLFYFYLVSFCLCDYMSTHVECHIADYDYFFNPITYLWQLSLSAARKTIQYELHIQTLLEWVMIYRRMGDINTCSWCTFRLSQSILEHF